MSQKIVVIALAVLLTLSLGFNAIMAVSVERTEDGLDLSELEELYDFEVTRGQEILLGFVVTLEDGTHSIDVGNSRGPLVVKVDENGDSVTVFPPGWFYPPG